jgi:hypothetical protein
MGMVADALGQLIMQGGPARPPTPTDLPALVGFFGPIPRAQNPAIARHLSGTPDGQLPPKGTAPRRAYDAALRRVQRARVRGSFNAADQAKVVEEVTARIEATHAQAIDRHVRRRLRQLRRDGLFMRVIALIRVSRIQKEAVMPSDSGGVPRYQYIDGQAATPALDAWEAAYDEEGDYEDVDALLLAAFFQAYWGDPDPLAEDPEVIEVYLRR